MHRDSLNPARHDSRPAHAIPHATLVFAAAAGALFAGCAHPQSEAQPRFAAEATMSVQGTAYRAVVIDVDSFPRNALFEVNGRVIGRAPASFVVAATSAGRFVEAVRVRAQVGEDDIDRTLRSPSERGAPRALTWVYASFAPGDPIPARIVATADGIEY